VRRIKITFKYLARNLRKNQTDAEQILWLQLRNRRLLNYKFRRQFAIEPYIVDFVCLELKLIIELDGSQHSEQADTERTVFLNQLGFRVVRFWNHDLFNNLEAVLEQINLVVGEQEKVDQ
jgi:crossover junction endodeoxyribonuclease RuvC